MERLVSERPSSTAPMGREFAEIPNGRVENVSGHYYVRVGCRTGVFHTLSEVKMFLSREAEDWLKGIFLGEKVGD